MANIILVEEDDRLRRQMELFLGELGEEHRIRAFKNLREFEALYFKTQKEIEKKPPLHSHPQLQKLTVDQQFWVLEQKLADTPALPFPSLTIELFHETGKIKKLEPEPGDETFIFGTAVEDFKTQAHVLETLLPVLFQKTYADLLNQIKSKKSAQSLLAFSSAQKEIWLVDVQLEKQDVGYSIKLQDMTSKLADTIAKAKAENQPDQEEEEDDELRLLSSIDLAIIKTTQIPKRPLPWFEEFHRNLKKFRLYPQEFRTRLVITKYEDDGVSKVDLIHPLLDDLIYLPLDRLIFLQKIEILLALPNIATPSYLFSQEANMEIEIAKRSWMERFSDVALAIRNPVPLVTGLMGHFYVDLTGEKENLEILGKVVKNEPHPEYPGEHLVYFSFFGMQKDTQSRIRKYLAKDNHYSSLLNDNREEFQFNPDNLFLTEEDRRLKNVILIDSDTDSSQQILGILREDVEQLQVAAFSSYAAFLQRYFEEEKGLDLSKIQPPAPKDLLGGSAIWYVELESHNLLEFVPSSDNTDTLLGYTTEEMFKDSQSWKLLFKSPDLESQLAEAFTIAALGQKFKTIAFIPDKTGTPKAVELKVSEHAKGLQVTLQTPQKEEVQEFILLQSKFTRWDLLIVDAAFISSDPETWVNNIQTNARQKGYLREDENLKVILIDNADSHRKPSQYKATQFRSLLVRPTEPRSLLMNLSIILNNPYTVYNFNNIGWSKSRVGIQVSKQAQLKSLAEFGATISHSRPIAPGTFLFLRKSIFDNAPRKNLCARFYACEEDSAEKGKYLCSLIYFGINEAFTKFARSWFRETYAASKQSDE